MNRFKKHIYRYRWLTSTHAAAALELALIAPILIILIFVPVEMVRYIITVQRVDRATYAVTDMVTRYAPATQSEAANEISTTRVHQDVWSVFKRTMKINQADIFTSTEGMGYYITSMVKNPDFYLPCFVWEIGSATGEIAGRVQSVTGLGVQSNNHTPDAARCNCGAPLQGIYNDYLDSIPDGTNIISGELFYEYKTLTNEIFGIEIPFDGKIITRAIFMHPRNGNLPRLHHTICSNPSDGYIGTLK